VTAAAARPGFRPRAGTYAPSGGDRTCAVCALWSRPRWRLYTYCGTEVRWALRCPRSWDAERHGTYTEDGDHARVDCRACRAALGRTC
jgi:hypothetical protein